MYRTVSIRFHGNMGADDPRKILVDHLSTHVPTDNWVWVYRREKYSQWYITMKSEDQADAIANLDPVEVSATLTLHTVSCGKERLHMRLHWLPSQVHPSAICRAFSNYGKIIEVKEELCTIPGLLDCKSGVRKVIIEITEREKDKLPHKIRVDAYTGLLTFRGRPPMCLKCGEVGHVRNFCPTRKTDEKTHEKKTVAESTIDRVLSEADNRRSAIASRALQDAVTRQNITVVAPDDDLDLTIIPTEMDLQPATPESPNTHPGTRSIDFYTDHSRVEVGYSSGAPESPGLSSSGDMDFSAALQNALQTAPSVKRARTEGPESKPIATRNRFNALVSDQD